MNELHKPNVKQKKPNTKNMHYEILCKVKKQAKGDFPGGAVVKNPPVNAGDMGSSPGLGRSHMPWSN